MTARRSHRGEPCRKTGFRTAVPRLAEYLNASAACPYREGPVRLRSRLLIRAVRTPRFPDSGIKFGALRGIDARLPETGSQVMAVRSVHRGGSRRETGCRRAPCLPGSPQLRGRATNIGEPSRRTRSRTEFLPASFASEMRSSRSATVRTFSCPTSVITSPLRRPLS